MRITARHVRVCLGLLWLLDGALQFQPFMYTKGFFVQIVGPAIPGQPAPIASPMTWAVHLAEPHQFVFNTVFALTQVAIGIGILIPRTAKTALAASFAWGAGVWWLGEGLGQVLTNASPLTGAPGAAILYVLIGALVWPTRRPRIASAVGEGPFGDLGGKLVWALLWVGMAALWLTPGNRSPDAVRDGLNGASGAAGDLRGVIDTAVQAAAGRGTAIAITLAVVSAVVGVGVFRRHRAGFLAVGIAISLCYWLFGQALGAITTGAATDPNSGPLFVLLALALMPAPAASRPADTAGRATVKPVPVPEGLPDPTPVLVSSTRCAPTPLPQISIDRLTGRMRRAHTGAKRGSRSRGAAGSRLEPESLSPRGRRRSLPRSPEQPVVRPAPGLHDHRSGRVASQR